MPLSGRAFLLFAIVMSTSAAAAAPVGPALPGRLPPDVVPVHYDIAVDPDAARLTFTGSETVTLSVLRPTRTIMMNAAELTVDTPTGNVVPDGGEEITITSSHRPETCGEYVTGALH